MQVCVVLYCVILHYVVLSYSILFYSVLFYPNPPEEHGVSWAIRILTWLDSHWELYLCWAAAQVALLLSKFIHRIQGSRTLTAFMAFPSHGTHDTKLGFNSNFFRGVFQYFSEKNTLGFPKVSLSSFLGDMMYNDTYEKQADVSQSEREPVTAQSMEYNRSDAMWHLRLDHKRFPLGSQDACLQSPEALLWRSPDHMEGPYISAPVQSLNLSLSLQPSLTCAWTRSQMIPIPSLWVF